MAEDKDKKAEKAEKKAEEKAAKEAKDAEKKEDGAEGAEGGEATPGEEGEGDAKAKKKKKLIIVVAAALVLILGGVGAAFMGGFLGHKGEESAEGGESSEGENGKAGLPEITYLDMDEFLVNLNTGGKQNSFLKMKVTLELPSPAEKSVVEWNMPRVRDSFQIYLRELRANDLQGAGGMQRLREELLLRVNKIIYPSKVSDILFKEIIVR